MRAMSMVLILVNLLLGACPATIKMRTLRQSR